MVLYSEKCDTRLDGKTVIVTGSNTGIGKETVKDLYKRGAHVIMACRSTEKAEETAKEIVDSCKEFSDTGKITVIELNLSNLKSIRECSEKILAKENRIDILINNAGVSCPPYTKTDDGFELQFGTNHLGHFLFTLLLLPKIIQSAPARIVTVASAGYDLGEMDFDDINWEKKKYAALASYGQSKLANILFTNELERRLKEANIEGVTVYSLHPGAIASDLGRHLGDTYCKGVATVVNSAIKTFGKTLVQGAQTTIYCAIDENAGKESGLYYADCKPKKLKSKALNTEDAKKLWDMSLDMVNLPNHVIVKA